MSNHLQLILACLSVALVWVSVGCQEALGPDFAQEYPAATAPIMGAPPVVASGPTSAPADEILTAKEPLKACLAYAAQRSPGLRAAFDKWKAATERVVPAGTLADPQFTYRYFIVEQMMRDGNMQHVFEISQTFPWFGKLRLRSDVAALEAMAEYERFQAEALKLVNRVKQAWYEYQYLGRAIAVNQENLELLKAVGEIARSRYESAQTGEADLLRAQTEVGNMENELASMKDMVTPKAARLNAAIGRAAAALLPPPPAIPIPPPKVNEDQLLTWLEENNPELKAMKIDAAREGAAAELAGKDYYPDFMLGFEYDVMVRAAGVDMGPQNPIAVMLSVNIPIWRAKYAAGVREARWRQLSAIHGRQDKANELSADLKMAAYNFRNAMRKIALYRDTLLPLARQSIQSLQAGYRSSKTTFLEVLDAQRVLLEFGLSSERALADANLAVAEMEMIAGREIAPAARTTSAPASQPAPGEMTK